MNQLSKEDVVKLLNNPSEDVRVETVGKISTSFNQSNLSQSEQKIAEDIFRKLAQDAAVRVRQALSEHLKENDQLPKDIAMNLAQDIDEVALPIIQDSAVLSEEDLIAIIQTDSVEKQKAVARRPHISEKISHELIETNNKEVVQEVVDNKTAHISENSYQKIIESFPEDQSIQESLVNRDQLPLTVSEKLISRVSQSLKKHLIEKHKIPDNIIDNIIQNTQERAIINLANCGSQHEVAILVRHLIDDNRLTPTLLLRALSMGYVTFFEMGLAYLAGVSLENVRLLIHEQGRLGLAELCKKADIPPKFFPFFKIAVKTVDMTVQEGIEENFSEIVIERVLTQISDETGFGADNIDYLIDRITHENVSAEFLN